MLSHPAIFSQPWRLDALAPGQWGEMKVIENAEVVARFRCFAIKLEQSAQKIAQINAMCKSFDGEFTLLWHNSNIIARQQQHLYQAVIESL